MRDLLKFWYEEHIHAFGDFNAKGSFNLQEQKSDKKGLIVESLTDIHPEGISAFPDDYTFARIL